MGDELSRGQTLRLYTRTETHTHTLQTDAGNDNTWRPKLNSNKTNFSDIHIGKLSEYMLLQLYETYIYDINV